MRRSIWLAGLVLLLTLAAAVTYWVRQHLVEKSVYITTHYQGEARRNWLYATQRLLERLGTPVQSVGLFSELPKTLGAKDTVLLATPGYGLTQGDAESLLRWVATGGHLLFSVYQPYKPKSGSNPLLDSLYIQVVDYYPTTPQSVNLQYGSPPQQLTLALRSHLSLHDRSGNAIRKAADGDRVYLLQYQWGDGLITVLNDLRLFSNKRLANQDHADLVWLLLGNPDRNGTVWLQYISQMPSLLRLLWELAWMPLIGAIFTTIAGLWASGYRLGPRLVPALPTQRSLREHLQASGRFLWHQGGQEDLLSAARQRTLQRVEQCFPHWQGLSAATQSTAMAERIGLTPEQIADALQTSRSTFSEQAFIQRIHTLQYIERHL